MVFFSSLLFPAYSQIKLCRAFTETPCFFPLIKKATVAALRQNSYIISVFWYSRFYRIKGTIFICYIIMIPFVHLAIFIPCKQYRYDILLNQFHFWIVSFLFIYDILRLKLCSSWHTCYLYTTSVNGFSTQILTDSIIHVA